VETLDTEEKLGEFTVYDIPYIRKDGQDLYELVVAQRCVEMLYKRLVQWYDIVAPYDPIIPDAGEVNVRNIATAREMAIQKFLHNAVDAIRNGFSAGPAECYRNLARSKGLEGKLVAELENVDPHRVSDVRDRDFSWLKTGNQDLNEAKLCRSQHPSLVLNLFR
jgi:hypothetical protein